MIVYRPYRYEDRARRIDEIIRGFDEIGICEFEVLDDDIMEKNSEYITAKKATPVKFYQQFPYNHTNINPLIFHDTGKIFSVYDIHQPCERVYVIKENHILITEEPLEFCTDLQTAKKIVFGEERSWFIKEKSVHKNSCVSSLDDYDVLNDEDYKLFVFECRRNKR